ncbi:hypothetical protein [Helicobacter sp. T3_23-1059]
MTQETYFTSFFTSLESSSNTLKSSKTKMQKPQDFAQTLSLSLVKA